MRHKIKIRLYSEQKLALKEKICLNEAQSHYLVNVMKCRLGDDILCFDNQNGEFICRIIEETFNNNIIKQCLCSFRKIELKEGF